MHINQVKNIEKYSREEFKYTMLKTLKNTAKSNLNTVKKKKQLEPEGLPTHVHVKETQFLSRGSPLQLILKRTTIKYNYKNIKIYKYSLQPQKKKEQRRIKIDKQGIQAR